MAETKEEQKTDFKGPVSLDAIFAATSGKSREEKKETPIIPEVKTEEKIEEVKKETPPLPPIVKPVVEKTTIEETEAYKKAKTLLELGFLEDFEIEDPEDEESSISVSDYKNMTETNLKELVDLHRQEKEKEISSKYLPKGDLKEHQLKVFEILSNGGDLSQIAETPEKALERPFEGFDMDDQQRQVDVRYTDLVHSKGLDHDSAVTIIDKEVKSGKLKEKASDTFEKYREAHTKYIDKVLEDQKKEKEFKDLNFRENKKLLTAKLKEAGLKESVYKKVASAYGKKNENGDYDLIDKLREALNNPEENHELILHLSDKKLFNETFKIKASHEAQKTIVRLASGASQKGNKKSSISKTEEVSAPWIRGAEIYNESIK